MRDASSELAERLHLLRLEELRLQLLLLRDIPDDADEVALLVKAELRDGEIHREGAAILALAADLTADADDLGLVGIHIVRNVRVMAAAIRLRHQLPDVLT